MSVQFPEIGILAIGIMLTLLTGGIDLSVTAIGNLGGILAALTLQQLVAPSAGPVEALPGVAAGILVALGVGLFCGLLNGLLITYIRRAPCRPQAARRSPSAKTRWRSAWLSIALPPARWAPSLPPL